MDDERQAIIKTLKEPKADFLLQAWYIKSTKTTENSIAARQKGNDLFIRCDHNSQTHEKIWKFYSESIAHAPVKSQELALAYGNRSALLVHLQKFEESIIDIDRALKINGCSKLKKKLLERKEKCINVLAEIKTAKLKSSTSISDVSNENHLKNAPNTNHVSETFNNLSLNDIEDLKARVEEILTRKKVADPYEAVSIQYNEKFGRHLVANRYIKPGEIIMVVKPYITSLNLNNAHAFCGHCLKTSWTNIPCDLCNWCMFCSEQCKEEAWKQYHDIECSVIPYINLNEVSDYWKQLALRSTVKAIREAGSIKQLKEELKLIDSCKSKLHKGFVDDKFHNDRYQSNYSLCHSVSEDVLDIHIDFAVLILIILAKSSNLFGNTKFNLNIIEDLITNDDVIFVGSLLLKFSKISDINAHSVMEGSSPCRFSSNGVDQCQKDPCCERGSCIAPIPSLLNHSCDPNVRKCFTEDVHMIVYALQPIQENAQLFDCYTGNYYETPLSGRQLIMKQFNLICNCLPCIRNWPTILLEKDKLHQHYEKNCSALETQLIYNLNSLLKNMKCLNTLDNLSKDIEKATSNLRQPSYTTATLISLLWTIFDRIYGMKLQIADKCFHFNK